MKRLTFSLIPLLLLAGCASQAPAPVIDRTPMPVRTAPAAASSALTPGSPGTYTVKRGDTLYRIALDQGQDYRDVASWNNITNPASIKEGQVLRVTPPGAETNGSTTVQPIATGSMVESRPLGTAPVVAAVSSDSVRREPKVNKEPYSDAAYDRLQKPGEPVATKAADPVKPSETKPAEPAVAPAIGPDDVAWAWPSPGKLLAPFNDASNKGLDLVGKAGDAVQAAGDGKVVYAGAGLRGYGQLVIVKHNGTFLSAYAHNQKILVKEGEQVKRGQKIAELGNTDSENGVFKLHFEIRRQGKPVDPMGYLPKR